MRYRITNLHERVLAGGVIGADGVLRVPEHRPVWVAELTRL